MLKKAWEGRRNQHEGPLLVGLPILLASTCFNKLTGVSLGLAFLDNYWSGVTFNQAAIDRGIKTEDEPFTWRHAIQVVKEQRKEAR